MPRRRIGLLLIVAVFAAVLLLFPILSGLLTDWWWFKEIGYQVVFTRELVTRALLFLAAGALTFGVLYGNLRLAQRGLVPHPIVLELGESAHPFNLTAALRRLSLPASLALGLLAGLAVTPAWSVVLRMIYRTPFGIADPVFSRDIGFYLFTLPGLGSLLGFLTGLVSISLLLLFPLYWIRGDIIPSRRQIRFEPSAGIHLGSLIAVLFLLTAVRLWDRDPLLQTFGQLQEIRTYYDFVSVDDDRYWIDGKYRQVLLSPRELNPASLPTRTFINEHLTFTHGMGLTLSPVNQVTIEGLPVLFIRDLPPVSDVSLKVTRPQIYYGEVANEFVFVGTKQREFDHPSGEANVYASYEGSGGVKVGNLLRRLVLAMRFGSSKILLSQDITNDSRVLYYRNIIQRAARALPFLRFDRDPYMVATTEGRLVWIADAYTASSGYPYAQRLEDGTSYMRNSVKLVIDAYHGTLTAYVSAPGDPLIRTWAKVFPGIFQPLDSMPADLRAHLRYPDDLYRVQTALYTSYHMEAPEDFYHREDQWQIPVVADAQAAVPFMRHIVMRLPDEPTAEFIYMVPFTPRGKDNLAAWMVARNDGDAYGKLRVYRLSRQSLVFGPQQIENRINQDTEVSRQVSLWDQGGSKVIRGDLLVIPIEQSLLYVQPLYLQAEGGKIPELKRVVVAYQNQVVMEETLDAGLARLFGGSAKDAPVAVAGTGPAPAAATSGPALSDAELQTLVAEARSRYQAALAAQRAGDWARYGEEIRKLGEVLERLGGKGGR